MSQHELKTWPSFYADVVAGRKRCELRRDDRGFRVGDTLILREFDNGDGGGFTGAATTVKVTHIVRDVPQFGLEPGYCILSITSPL